MNKTAKYGYIIIILIFIVILSSTLVLADGCCYVISISTCDAGEIVTESNCLYSGGNEIPGNIWHANSDCSDIPQCQRVCCCIETWSDILYPSWELRGYCEDRYAPFTIPEDEGADIPTEAACESFANCGDYVNPTQETGCCYLEDVSSCEKNFFGDPDTDCRDLYTGNIFDGATDCTGIEECEMVCCCDGTISYYNEYKGWCLNSDFDVKFELTGTTTEQKCREICESGCITPYDNMEITEDTILCPGTYNLPNGIKIEADGITLDCNGATLKGDKSNSGISLKGGTLTEDRLNNVVIKNCNIIDYSTGIDVTFSNNNNFTNNKVINNNVGFHLGHASVNNLLKNNYAEGNEDSGFYIHTTGLYASRSTIEGNIAKGNGRGFDIFVGSYDKIVRNQARNNNKEGFSILCDACNINENLAENNVGDGFWLYNEFASGEFSGNTAKGNENGFYFFRVLGIPSPWDISDNIAINNRQAGFFLLNSWKNIYKGNIISNNAIGFEVYESKDDVIEFNKIFKNKDYNLHIRYQDKDIIAENNWWGSADEDYIKSKIYDCLDDSSKGCVDYTPWLTTGPLDVRPDLTVSSSDISFEKTSTNVKITAIVHNNGNYNANNVEVKFLDIYSESLIRESTINIGAIEVGNLKEAIITWDLDENHIIRVIADPEDKISELDENNNNADKEYIGTLKYYVEADVPPSTIGNEIENYVKENIRDGVIVNNEVEADIKVLIGRHNPIIIQDSRTLEEEGWGFTGGGIKFQDQFCTKPYCGIVGDLIVDGKKEIYIEANDVDGFIAASKTFIEEQDSFKNSENTIFIDERNEDAIAIYDYLHTSENLPYYKQDTEEFRVIFGTALQDEMYTQEHLSTTANGVTLRLLHIQPAFSDIFLNYKDTVQMPVVLARGLWSNLYTWKEFGEELANKEGRDTWLIEITGGPGQDCDDCPNYDFDDLTDFYVPALLNKVLTETGKSKLQYVGFSNGCRATLSSLEKGSFDPSKVDTFVGVGCPGAFEGYSTYSYYLNEHASSLREDLHEKTHLTGEELGNSLRAYCSSMRCRIAAHSLRLLGDEKLSYNLADDYLNWIEDNSDSQPGIGVNINRALIFNGRITESISDIYDPTRNIAHDLMISIEDGDAIYNNIQASKKYQFKTFGLHGGPSFMQLADKHLTKRIVTRFLNNEPFSYFDIYYIEEED